jgi:hypothetical protein
VLRASFRLWICAFAGLGTGTWLRHIACGFGRRPVVSVGRGTGRDARFRSLDILEPSSRRVGNGSWRPPKVFLRRRPPGNGAGESQHPGGVPDSSPPRVIEVGFAQSQLLALRTAVGLTRNARPFCGQVSGSGTPVRGAGPSDAFPVVVPPFPGTTTGYPLPTLRVGLPHLAPQRMSKLSDRAGRPVNSQAGRLRHTFSMALWPWEFPGEWS